VITRVQGESKPLWHAEDVTMSDILAALSEVRSKFARAEAGDDEHIHPRNCVMTLIGVAPSDEFNRYRGVFDRILSSMRLTD